LALTGTFGQRRFDQATSVTVWSRLRLAAEPKALSNVVIDAAIVAEAKEHCNVSNFVAQHFLNMTSPSVSAKQFAEANLLSLGVSLA
jgi:hypothetical protein